MHFTVIFDANVLYPAPMRDFLISLSITGVYAAKWTDQIHDEWMRNLIRNRPELEEKLIRTRELMNTAVPDSLVSGYKPLIAGLNLPDPDDRHVLAAAICCGAQIIVTNNLKDFPEEQLSPFGIEAMTPDDFIECQFGLRQSHVLRAAKAVRGRLAKPPMTPEEYLGMLAAQGLVVTAELLKEYVDVI